MGGIVAIIRPFAESCPMPERTHMDNESLWNRNHVLQFHDRLRIRAVRGLGGDHCCTGFAS